MTQLLSCPHGHEWTQVAGDPSIGQPRCPICGTVVGGNEPTIGLGPGALGPAPAVPTPIASKVQPTMDLHGQPVVQEPGPTRFQPPSEISAPADPDQPTMDLGPQVVL